MGSVVTTQHSAKRDSKHPMELIVTPIGQIGRFS